MKARAAQGIAYKRRDEARSRLASQALPEPVGRMTTPALSPMEHLTPDSRRLLAKPDATILSRPV
jgi:hypothetical protein